jgi:hypothetical protein
MSDKKRGRPKLLPEWWSRSLYPDIHTTRQQQARYLANEAMGVLGLMPKGSPDGQPIFPLPTWLVDWSGANRGKTGAVKWCVLEQLGRMSRDGWDIHGLATELDGLGLSAKEAAARLRVIRRGLRADQAEEEKEGHANA